MAAKRGGLQGVLIILGIITIAVVLAEFGRALLLLSASPSQSTSPHPTQPGFTAYCPGSPATPAGVYPAGPGSTPPAGCASSVQQIQATVQDLYNPGQSLGGSYSCVFYWNSGNPATFSPLGAGALVSGGSWQTGPSVSAAGGVCAPTGWTPTTGTQVVIKVCRDSPSNCVIDGFSSQKTVAYCPLASQVPTVTLIVGTSAPAQACNPGPGWGSVPYVIVLSATPPTLYAPIPIIMIAGQNPTGSNSGYNTATPILLDERYQNGTDFTAANTCFVNTGAAACDLPKATSRGQFSMTWGVTTGGAGTAPANPAGSGYMTSTPVDLQSGATARGPLQLVLSIELTATTNNDMCTITTPTLLGAAPVVQVKTATDVFYLFVIRDLSVTKITDVSGNALNVGSAKLGIQLDCSAVFNGSGDVVTITPILYAYFSLQYFQSYHGTVLNAEASPMSQTAVITIRT